MSKKQRRQQASKGNPLAGSRNFEATVADLERRRSGAAGVHRTPKDYRRKPKHTGRGWE